MSRSPYPTMPIPPVGHQKRQRFSRSSRTVMVGFFCASLVLTGQTAATAAGETEKAVTFTDVPAGMMFAKEMSWLANEGISTGWSDGTYRPLTAINRDAMAAFLYRLAGSPEFTAPGTSPFQDVSPGQQHYKEMAWLHQQQISTGWDVGNGKREYRPTSAINRDAMAAFLYRFENKPEFQAPTTPPFSDISSTTQFYTEISWLHAKGIATGWDNGDGTASYRPLSPINRDAMAAYLYRLSLPPAEDGVVTSPDTLIIDSAALAQKYVQGDTIITFNSVGAGAPDIDPGNVLVSGFSEFTPDGMLVRVQQVTNAPDGKQTAVVQQATLPDAIYDTNGLVTPTTTIVKQEFLPADGVEVIDNAQASAAPFNRNGGRIPAEELATASDVSLPIFEKTFKFSDTLSKSVTGTAWKTVDVEGTGTLALSSEFGVSSDVNAEVDIHWASLKQAKFTLDTGLSAETTARATGTLTGTAEKNLGTVNTWAHVQVGPVPVEIQFISSIDLKAKSEWTADTFVTAAASATTTVGMSYKDGNFQPVAEYGGNAEATFQGPQLTSESSVTIGPTLTAKLYGIAGLTGGFDAYAKYATGPETCAHEVGLAGRIGVIAGVEVFGMKLTDEWKKELTKNLVLWQGDLCKPVTPPVDDVTEEVFGDGIAVQEKGGAGDSSQWGRATDYGPGGAAWILSTGNMQNSVGTPGQEASSDLGTPGNTTLSEFIGGLPTFDAASYWAKVVPSGDTLHVRYFFASEEYPEYVGSNYNDVMGVFVNGTNCALVPGTQTPISVNNVNDHTNQNYYIDNTAGASGFNTAMDGMTTALTCSVPVQPGVPVTVEIAVADTSDGILDSAVALLDGGIWSD